MDALISSAVQALHNVDELVAEEAKANWPSISAIGVLEQVDDVVKDGALRVGAENVEYWGDNLVIATAIDVVTKDLGKDGQGGRKRRVHGRWLRQRGRTRDGIVM